MRNGIYIHIPFCASRCIYCGFYSQTRMDISDDYVTAVLAELRAGHSTLFAAPATIYIGGGTPSTLTVEQLSRLVSGIEETIDTSGVVEWTMECNPDDISPTLAEWIVQSPVTRVSLGVQTFSDTRLRWLRRRHTAAEARAAVSRLRSVGLSNISLDLMFGFPGETHEEWKHDINGVLALRPEHISAYSLMYDEGTPLAAMLSRSEVSEIDEELSRQMYETLIDRLAAAGYEHYEISNFCLPVHESRHNSAYWNLTPYLGIGAAAHSFDGKRRWWNVSDICRYIDGIMSGQPIRDQETIDGRTRYNDIITTALRTRRGITLDTLPTEQRKYLLSQAERHIVSGCLAVSDGHLMLTREGIFTSDDIQSDLILL